MRNFEAAFVMLIFFSPQMLGQQPVRGAVLYDNPDKLKPVVYIYPWYLNTWKPNTNSGMIFGMKICAGKMVDFDVDLQISYKNKTRTDADANTFPPFNREEFRISVNGDLNRQSRGLRTRYTANSDVVPYVTRRLCFSPRIGFNHTGSTIQAADVNARLVSDATGDTSVYTGRAFFSTYNCVIGFSIKSIFNAVISAEGRRISTGKYLDFYGDMIANVGMNFREIDNGVDSGYVVIQAKNPFGYRAGLQIHDPSKMNLCFGIEFGSSAGPRFNYKPTYFVFKVGLSITDKMKVS